jgi:hypothetical protein
MGVGRASVGRASEGEKEALERAVYEGVRVVVKEQR